MFIGITGEPGSGKSAYAVDYILKNKDNYRNIYVNINGFKFNRILQFTSKFIWGVPYKKVPNIVVSYTIYKFITKINFFSSLNYKPLNFPVLYEILSNCKDIYDRQVETLGSSDENEIDEPIVKYLESVDFIRLNPNYIEYKNSLRVRNNENIFKKIWLDYKEPIKKEIQYLPTLFVIDEVQNHMGAIDPNTGKENRTADPILTWWVSYHRHLFMDVLILSQQYNKIHIAYRRDIAYFLDAIESQSLLLSKFSSNLVYNKHKESPYTKKNRVSRVKVKKRPEIFRQYISGDAVRTKSVVLPWLIFSAVLFLVVVSIFSYVISTFSNDDISDDNVTKRERHIIQNISHYQNNVVDTTDYTKFTYLKLNCIYDTCSNKLHNIELNIDELNATVFHTQSKISFIKKYSDMYASVSLLATDDFINLFQGAKNNEKSNTQGFSLIN